MFVCKFFRVGDREICDRRQRKGGLAMVAFLPLMTFLANTSRHMVGFRICIALFGEGNVEVFLH